MPQPVVAKIRGACLGGGFALSLSCDLAYASEDSFFGEPEVKFGGSTMSPILAWALPPRQFKELILTGRFIDAKRAETLGLINEVVAPMPSTRGSIRWRGTCACCRLAR